MFLGVEPEDVHILKRNLLELKTLTLKVNLRNFIGGTRENREVNRFKKVKHFIITVYDHGVGGINFKLPFIFDELERLEVYSTSHRSLPLSWIKFACPNDLVHLKLRIPNLSISDLMKIADQWPNLEEILLRHNEFQTEIFIEFINKFERLKKIDVVDMSSDPFYRYDLRRKLDEKWRVMALNSKAISIILKT